MSIPIIEEILCNREWRIKELESLKKIYINAIYPFNQDVHSQYFLMCIPYIYAHWEGYVTETFKLLIDYINKLQLEKSDVINEIYTFAHLKTYRTLAGKQGFMDCCAFSEKLIQNHSKKFNIDIKDFKTNSNLNYKQLTEIFSWFNMDIGLCANYEYDINQLVNKRNKIAHGEDGIVIEFKHIEAYTRILHEIFDYILLTIQDYIINNNFLKNNTSK